MGRNRWPLTPPAPQPGSGCPFRPRPVSSSVLSPRSAAPTTQLRAIAFASRPPPGGRAQRRPSTTPRRLRRRFLRHEGSPRGSAARTIAMRENAIVAVDVRGCASWTTSTSGASPQSLNSLRRHSHGGAASALQLWPTCAIGRQHKRSRTGLGGDQRREAGVRPVEHPIVEASVPTFVRDVLVATCATGSVVGRRAP